jgi:hypothetical protein
MAINTNTAEKQKEMGALIPNGTIAPVILNIRGRKMTKADDAEMLDCEFTITEGEYEKRKVWENMMITSNGSDGHNTAVDITMSRVRGLLESAYGIDPEDDSDAAIAAREIEDWEDLDQMEALAKIGIEKGKEGYKDKNKILVFITPDMDEYEESGFQPVKPGKKKPASKAKTAAKPAGKAGASKGVKKPSWDDE